jgi:hypothetical protein
MIAGQRIRSSAAAEPPQPQHRLPKAAQRPAAAGRAAPAPLGESSFAMTHTSSLGTSSVAR